MGRGCKESLSINLKTERLIIRLKSDLEPGTSVDFVVEGQRWQRNWGKRWIFVVYKRFNGETKKLVFWGWRKKIQVMVVKNWCWEGWCGGQGLVKEELCKSVVEIWRRNNTMMKMCLIFEKIMQVIYVYVPQSGKPDIKNKFCDELVH